MTTDRKISSFPMQGNAGRSFSLAAATLEGSRPPQRPPTAPPVYRPHSSTTQPKSAVAADPPRLLPPPVYRPQTRATQPKAALAADPPRLPATQVYRPQAQALRRGSPRPAAPPAYRPKLPTAQSKTVWPANPARHPAPPIYCPQSSRTLQAVLEIKGTVVVAVEKQEFPKTVKKRHNEVVAQLTAMIGSEHSWSYDKWSAAAKAVFDHLEEGPTAWAGTVPTELDATGDMLPQPHQFKVGHNPNFKEEVKVGNSAKETANLYLARCEDIRSRTNEVQQEKVKVVEKTSKTGANDAHQSLSESASYLAKYQQALAALELAEEESADSNVIEILKAKKQHAFAKAQKKGETHHK
jgi:hypothetical protein